MRAARVVVAAWLLALPAGADAQRAGETVTYFIGAGSAGSGFKEADATLARWALEAWAKQVDPTIELRPAPEAAATIRIHWVGAEEGLFGETRARRLNGRIVEDVFVHPDTDGLGTDIAREARRDPLFRDAIVYLTCVHELGHAFGLPHTQAFADIMYSFQYGGDFVAYFRRFRTQLETWDDIQHASPFSAADREAFRSRHASVAR